MGLELSSLVVTEYELGSFLFFEVFALECVLSNLRSPNTTLLYLVFTIQSVSLDMICRILQNNLPLMLILWHLEFFLCEIALLNIFLEPFSKPFSLLV